MGKNDADPQTYAQKSLDSREIHANLRFWYARLGRSKSRPVVGGGSFRIEPVCVRRFQGFPRLTLCDGPQGPLRRHRKVMGRGPDTPPSTRTAFVSSPSEFN